MRLGRVSERAAVAAACVMGVIAAAPAGASAAPGGLIVSPTRIDAKVRPGDSLPPIVLRNESSQPVVVDVAAAMAGQNLAGLPVVDSSRSAIAAAKAMLRVSPRRVRVLPNGRARVGVIVGRPPRTGQVGAYAVVTLTAVQEAPGKAKGSVVAAAVRMSSNLLLRFPGKVRVDARTVGLRAEQGPKRTLRFLARMRNDGYLHVRPVSRLTIRTAAGRTVLRQDILTQNVIPGAERELVAQVTKVLGAGDYVARVDARAGRRRSSKEMRFHLVGPNELPTAHLKIVALQTPSPDAGEAFDESVYVLDDGNAPIRGAGTLTITRTGGRAPVATIPLDGGMLEPGKPRRLTVKVPGLDAAGYAATARFVSEGRTLDERTVAFRAGAQPSLVQRILDWLAAHVPYVIAGFGLLLVAVVGALLAYIRRLRRRVAVSV
jgi:hypothetical protein